jgi:gamma-glutamylputrescine oxidase
LGVERETDFIKLSRIAAILSPNASCFATNGYTDRSSEWARQRVLPVASYQIATEPLPIALMNQLMPRRRMISDTRKEVTYMRPSPNAERILFGCRPRCLDRSATKMAPLLYARLLRVFPELAAYRVTHAWRGNVATTWDGMPHIKEHDGIMYALGCNGSGVALMSWLGYRAAQTILDPTGARTTFDEIPFPILGPRYGRPWIAPLVSGAYLFRDFLANPGEVTAERLRRTPAVSKG